MLNIGKLYIEKSEFYSSKKTNDINVDIDHGLIIDQFNQ